MPNPKPGAGARLRPVIRSSTASPGRSRAATVCRRSAGMLRRLSRLALLAFAAGAVCGAAGAEVRNPNGVAVIIGNKEYQNPDVPPVAYAHRDAEAFKRYVIEVLGFDPDNVFELRDADRGEIFKAFGRRGGTMSDLWAGLARLPEGGDVVVYYSGHGVPGREGGKGYLLPVNVPPRAAQEDGYPLDLLYEKLGALDKARSVQVFLDACFSGGSHAGFLVQGASPVAMSAAMPMEAADKVTVLTAAQGSQLASWDKEAEHGLFTHHLLDALYGKGDRDRDGRVTADEARAYLDSHMSAAAWLAYAREQKAVLLKTAGAEVVLASAVDGAFPARPVLDPVSVTETKREDDEAFAQAKAEGTVAAFEGYLSSCKLCGHAEQARRLKAEAERQGGEERLQAERKREEKALGLGLSERKAVQRGLSSLGLDVGPADGVFGHRTRTALRAWQESMGLEVTGYLTREESEALVALGREAERKAREEEALRAEAERKRADAEAFARAKGEGTVAALDGYLSLCDEWCGHAEEAKRLRVEAERERFLPGKKFRDCVGCPELVVVPEGTYMMGSTSGGSNEKPVHRVTIARPFAVGVYEVTFAEWDACESDGGCGGYRPSDSGWGRGKRPVINVSWEDAQGYVRWLSGKTGEEYRLLSESEWEYVARAGTGYWWGDDVRYWWGDDVGWNRANCAGCESRWDGRQTAPVGSFSANAFGLHDVHGNVWEWVEDCWNGGYHGAPADGSAWESGNCSRRVRRGGSWAWGIGPWFIRSANRSWGTTGSRYDYAGFRVARTLTP